MLPQCTQYGILFLSQYPLIAYTIVLLSFAVSDRPNKQNEAAVTVAITVSVIFIFVLLCILGVTILILCLIMRRKLKGLHRIEFANDDRAIMVTNPRTPR